MGILDTSQAIEIAQEKGLDLVEIVPNIDPPVCKIIDFGKFKYQQAKKEKRAKHKKSDVKGIRIGLKTSLHDLEHKARQADKFLKQGHKIRIEIKLRGREKAHKDLAKEKIEHFLELLSEKFKVEQEPKKCPSGMEVMITKTS